MTTEVAIINREAIALAADSAVTIDMVNGRKIYNSANKVFALSQSHPIGIMVYGGAHFSGVPWETLIKVYRQTNPNISFDYLRQYATHFFRFLEDNQNYFLDADKKLEARRFASAVYQEIRNKIIQDTELEFKKNYPVSKSTENQIINNKIESYLNKYKNSDILHGFESITLKSIQDEHQDVFQSAINDVFEKLKITSQNNKKLTRIAAYAIKINLFLPGTYSGIVFAGFGEKEVIPDLVTYQANLLLKGKVRKKYVEAKSHNNRPSPILIPFAQEDVIFTFLTGISPDLESISGYVVNTEATKIIDSLLNEVKSFNKLSESDIKNLNDIMELGVRTLVNTYFQQMQDVKQKLYIEDVLNIINVLPKEELAEMAESLVSLTSLRRKISIVEETVGGPTDVALISKGDGFIWIKRKHYFDADINPGFFARKNQSQPKGDEK